MEILGANINLLAVLAAAIVSFLIGVVWYSKYVFGKQWRKLSGKSDAEVKKMFIRVMIGGFVISLVMSFVLAHFIFYSSIFLAVFFQSSVAVLLAMVTAFLIWIGFVAPVVLNNLLYKTKPMMLVLIDGGYYLVSLLAMAAVIAAMGY